MPPSKPDAPRIFISCVTTEFRLLRESLRFYLSRAGCDVVTQEEFHQTSGTTLEKLDDYIKACHAVIYIVGEKPGTIAATDRPKPIADFLAANQPFPKSHPEIDTRIAGLIQKYRTPIKKHSYGRRKQELEDAGRSAHTW